MTANLILIILSLFILHAAGGAERMAPWWASLASLLILPVTFVPVLVISHYMFEATPAWLFWPGFLSANALLAGLVLRLLRNERGSAAYRLLMLLGCAGIAVSLWVGPFRAGYESGPTPVMWRDTALITGWSGGLLAVAAISATLLSPGGPRPIADRVAPVLVTMFLAVGVLASV